MEILWWVFVFIAVISQELCTAPRVLNHLTNSFEPYMSHRIRAEVLISFFDRKYYNKLKSNYRK